VHSDKLSNRSRATFWTKVHPSPGALGPGFESNERRVDSSIDGPPLRRDYWSPDQPLLDSAPSGAPIV
jgi:hypothetical protein